MTNPLARISAAVTALAAAKTLDEITQLRDIGKAAAAYASAAKLGRQAQNDALELVLWAERKAGELLAGMELPGRGGGDTKSSAKQELDSLAKMGIEKRESSSWQRLAAIPEDQFAESVEHLKARGEKLTSTGLQREAGLLTNPVKATGPLLENEGIEFGFWALPRPLTSGWGSGGVWQRMIAEGLGTPDAAFGVRDNIPAGVTGIDRSTGYEWDELPFKDSQFAFGYWDPPYDSLYKQEGIEIWRTVRRLAILHTHIWPRSWLQGALRRGMYAITMGPMKQIRCLQVFDKSDG